MRILVVLSLFLCLFSCKQKADKSEELASQIDILSKEVDENPLEVQPLLKRAKFNLNKKKHESSLFDLKQCLKIDSTNSECNYLAALCYFEISKYDKSKTEYGKLALRTIKNALSSDQNNFLALALYGEINIAYAKYKEAIEFFNKSLSIEYNQFEIHHLMGYAFKKLDQFDEAINCFQNSININPDFI